MRGIDLVNMYEALVQSLREKLRTYTGPHRRCVERQLRITVRCLDEAHDKVRAEKRLARRLTNRQMRRLHRQRSGLGPHPLPQGHRREITRNTIRHVWDEWYIEYVPAYYEEELAFLTDMATRKRLGFQYLQTGSSSEDEGIGDSENTDSDW